MHDHHLTIQIHKSNRKWLTNGELHRCEPVLMGLLNRVDETCFFYKNIDIKISAHDPLLE